MNSRGVVGGMVVLVAGFCASSMVYAENCSGTYHNVGHVADTQDLGNGVTLASFTSLSSNFFKESGELRAGSCSGYVLSMADGKVRVVYACARKNKAGDVAVDEGTLEPGASRGTWNVTTATGALARAIGDSGWWQGAIEHGKVSAGTWGGICR